MATASDYEVIVGQLLGGKLREAERKGDKLDQVDILHQIAIYCQKRAADKIGELANGSRG